MTEWTKKERGEVENGVVILLEHKINHLTTYMEKQNSHNAPGLRALALNTKEGKCRNFTETWREVAYREIR
jgi:hypothetical protein